MISTILLVFEASSTLIIRCTFGITSAVMLASLASVCCWVVQFSDGVGVITISLAGPYRYFADSRLRSFDWGE